MEYILLGVMVTLAVGLLVYGIKKKKMDALVNYGLRIVGGTLGIYCANVILGTVGVNVNVGINPYNLLTIGILGTPGFLLLYGIGVYFVLK